MGASARAAALSNFSHDQSAYKVTTRDDTCVGNKKAQRVMSANFIVDAWPDIYVPGLYYTPPADNLQVKERL
jgi:hypothetical protein